MTPYFGTISLAFVGAPTIKVQLLPYNRVRLMRVPVVQVCHQVFFSTYVTHAISQSGSGLCQIHVKLLFSGSSNTVCGSYAISFLATRDHACAVLVPYWFC